VKTVNAENSTLIC